jgi:hypothetical protein
MKMTTRRYLKKPESFPSYVGIYLVFTNSTEWLSSRKQVTTNATENKPLYTVSRNVN